jgi:hypothetical protein
MKPLKYEFTPTQWATAKAKIETTGTDPEGETYTYWNPELVTAVVELGHLCTQWGTDAEGNQVCEVTSPKYAVDILWTAEPMTTSFAPYVVWPAPCGVHIFAGWESAYATEYCVANPDAPYCQPPVPPVPPVAI